MVKNNLYILTFMIIQDISLYGVPIYSAMFVNVAQLQINNFYSNVHSMYCVGQVHCDISVNSHILLPYAWLYQGINADASTQLSNVNANTITNIILHINT